MLRSRSATSYRSRTTLERTSSREEWNPRAMPLGFQPPGYRVQLESSCRHNRPKHLLCLSFLFYSLTHSLTHSRSLSFFLSFFLSFSLSFSLSPPDSCAPLHQAWQSPDRFRVAGEKKRWQAVAGRSEPFVGGVSGRCSLARRRANQRHNETGGIAWIKGHA